MRDSLKRMFFLLFHHRLLDKLIEDNGYYNNKSFFEFIKSLSYQEKEKFLKKTTADGILSREYNKHIHIIDDIETETDYIIEILTKSVCERSIMPPKSEIIWICLVCSREIFFNVSNLFNDQINKEYIDRLISIFDSEIKRTCDKKTKFPLIDYFTWEIIFKSIERRP